MVLGGGAPDGINVDDNRRRAVLNRRLKLRRVHLRSQRSAAHALRQRREERQYACTHTFCTAMDICRASTRRAHAPRAAAPESANASHAVARSKTTRQPTTRAMANGSGVGSTRPRKERDCSLGSEERAFKISMRQGPARRLCVSTPQTRCTLRPDRGASANSTQHALTLLTFGSRTRSQTPQAKPRHTRTRSRISIAVRPRTAARKSTGDGETGRRRSRGAPASSHTLLDIGR